MSISKLAQDFVVVMEKAAIASAEYNGKEDTKGADEAATSAMRNALNEMDIDGEIVIGEGERDEAPMLYIGEKVGTGKGIEVAIAVDPLEGTNLCAKNLPGAICVMAIGKKGSLFHAPDTYMDKIVTGPEVSAEISLNKSLNENLKIIADSYKIQIDELNIIVLDRERHIDLISDLRELGVNVRLISDGDINAGIEAALPHMNTHALMGIGAAPEGVIKAAAIKGLGGRMRAKFKPENEEVIRRMKEMGITDLEKEYTEEDLAKGNEVMFIATGVTSGNILKGIQIKNGEIHTDSIVIDASLKKVTRLQSVYLA